MSDRYYFFNTLTEVSSWTLPPEFCKLPPLDVNKAEVVLPPSTTTNSNNESSGSRRATRKELEKKKSNESLQYPHINPVVGGNDTRRHILPPLNHSTGLVVNSPNLKTYFSSSLY
jgi:hypothetical protein